MASPVNLATAFGLPPERAIEYFRAKGQRVTKSWRDIDGAAHARAFTVAGVLKAEVLDDIRGALDEALANGQTYQQFLKELRPKLKAKGWWGIAHDPETGEVVDGRAMTPHRLRTVYQTNLQSAYMAGRYKAHLENAERRPYWEYVAILDSRTRPRHRSLHGRVFRYDDPAWGALYPPNGYNCRCRVKALSAEEFASTSAVLSRGEGRMEDTVRDMGKRGKMTVRGYRDPGTGDLFAPDPGFDNNPGQGAFGLDTELARRTKAIKSREVRNQVWQALNNSPLRQAEFKRWTDRVLQSGRAGNSAQVIGFVDEDVADFFQAMAGTEAARVVAINEKRLMHAESARHLADGIALTPDQIAALPGILAKPDAVYFDRAHDNLVYVRKLADGGVIYVAVEPGDNMKRVGAIDALVNAYKLQPGEMGAGRLKNTQRYEKMGGAGR